MRIGTGKGVVEHFKEKGITLKRLDGAHFTAVIMESAGYGEKSVRWSSKVLGPLDAWQHGRR